MFCHVPIAGDLTLPAFVVSCHVSTERGGRRFVAPLAHVNIHLYYLCVNQQDKAKNNDASNKKILMFNTTPEMFEHIDILL